MKLLSKVAISFKPIDAHNSLQTDIELSKKGGYGAVREMIDILIERLNLKDEWMKRWL